MEFKKFHSIENSYQEKFMNAINVHPCSSELWVVLEKVHGANLSFSCDGTEVKVGKRTAFITSEEFEKFYKCQTVVEKYTKHIQQLFTICSSKFNATRIIVYGELFGGYYPDCDSTGPPVQKGVHYAPDHGFYAFDLRIDGKYLNYDITIKLFKQVELVYAKVLYRGLLKDVLEWSDNHKSDPTTIPAYSSLPAVSGNNMEGHILKPVEPAYFPNTSAVVIKNKNPAFVETRIKSPKVQEPTTIDPDLQEAIDCAVLYVTEQRYDNVVSKIGTVTRKDAGKLTGLLSRDALEDYNKEHSLELKKEHVKVLNKAVNSVAQKVVLKALV